MVRSDIILKKKMVKIDGSRNANFTAFPSPSVLSKTSCRDSAHIMVSYFMINLINVESGAEHPLSGVNGEQPLLTLSDLASLKTIFCYFGEMQVS